MEIVDCSNMVVKDIINIIKDFPICDLCIKDRSLVILNHTGYGIKELIIEK